MIPFIWNVFICKLLHAYYLFLIPRTVLWVMQCRCHYQHFTDRGVDSKWYGDFPVSRVTKWQRLGSGYQFPILEFPLLFPCYFKPTCREHSTGILLLAVVLRRIAWVSKCGGVMFFSIRTLEQFCKVLS